jgi:hypothetical protein
MVNSVKDQITWSGIQNWMPLIASAVSIALTFATLDRRLALVEQKLDTLISSTEAMTGKYTETRSEMGRISLRINTIETILKIRQ